jgi:hypothetical protein
MTSQHIIGELSQILGDLEALSVNATLAPDLGQLRREAETGPLMSLRPVAVRALALTDGLCWESLTHADATGFLRQAAVGTQLHEFGLCSGLLEDDQPRV